MTLLSKQKTILFSTDDHQVELCQWVVSCKQELNAFKIIWLCWKEIRQVCEQGMQSYEISKTRDCRPWYTITFPMYNNCINRKCATFFVGGSYNQHLKSSGGLTYLI